MDSSDMSQGSNNCDHVPFTAVDTLSVSLSSVEATTNIGTNAGPFQMPMFSSNRRWRSMFGNFNHQATTSPDDDTDAILDDQLFLLTPSADIISLGTSVINSEEPHEFQDTSQSPSAAAPARSLRALFFRPPLSAAEGLVLRPIPFGRSLFLPSQPGSASAPALSEHISLDDFLTTCSDDLGGHPSSIDPTDNFAPQDNSEMNHMMSDTSNVGDCMIANETGLEMINLPIAEIDNADEFCATFSCNDTGTVDTQNSYVYHDSTLSSLSCIDLSCFETITTARNARECDEDSEKATAADHNNVEHGLEVVNGGAEIEDDRVEIQEEDLEFPFSGSIPFPHLSSTAIGVRQIGHRVIAMGNGNTYSPLPLRSLSVTSLWSRVMGATGRDNEELVDSNDISDLAGVATSVQDTGDQPANSNISTCRLIDDTRESIESERHSTPRRQRRHSDPFGSQSSSGSNDSVDRSASGIPDNWYFYDPRLRPSNADPTRHGSPVGGGGEGCSSLSSMWAYIQGLRELGHFAPIALRSPPAYEDIAGPNDTSGPNTMNTAEVIQQPPPYAEGTPVSESSDNRFSAVMESDELSVQAVVRITNEPPPYYDDIQQPSEHCVSLLCSREPPTYDEAVNRELVTNTLSAVSEGSETLVTGRYGVSGEAVGSVGLVSCHGQQLWSSEVTSAAAVGSPPRLFGGMPAVRWNRNMCVNRWTSLPTWVVS